MDIRRINQQVSVSPQISIEDVEKIKAAGFVAIINNRPDGEEEDQPWNEDIEAEALRLGIPYFFVPVAGQPFAERAIAKTRAILEKYDGPVFLFCRSGTRCANLWALTQAGRLPVDEIIGAAGKAGYDISPLAKRLGEALAVA